MTLLTTRTAAGWLTGLYLGCLAIAAAIAEPAQSPRELRATFHQDFRAADYSGETLLPVGAGEVFHDGKGLRITFPVGQGKLRDTGVFTTFSVRGDFDVTLAFEILKADRPKAGHGVGPLLYAGNQTENDAVVLARRLLPDGKAVLVAERVQHIQGKTNRQILKSLPATAAAGTLRLERRGATVRYRVREGDAPEFVTVAEGEFGKADVYAIEAAGGTGGSDSGLDLRLLDFAVRAEALPGLADAGPKRAGSGVRRFDAGQLADLDERLQKLNARLAPTVVRLIDGKKRAPASQGGWPGGWFSGVLISPAGDILTCAHHHLAPNTKLLVELTDGRKVKATIRGSVKQKVSAASRYPAADVGMARLDEQGEWPSAALGRSAGLKEGDLCLSLGYPGVHRPGQPPLFRLGRVLVPDPLGRLRTTCRALPGASGGPVFDLEGRVVGVLQSMESIARGITHSSPVEGFLMFQDRLRAGETVEFEKELPDRIERRSDPGGSWEPTEEMVKTLAAAHRSTVEVLCDGKAVALGLIVGADGWVLTKRTELTGPTGPRRLVCRLADGTRLEARVTGESRAHDLALLKVSATGLPAVRWGEPGGPRVGQLIASLGPDPRPLHYGVVGAVRVLNPGVRGDLPFRVGPAPAGATGVAFAEFMPRRREVDAARGLLNPGDLITHLDGVPTPTAEDFANVRNRLTKAPEAIAGEGIKLTVRREGKTTQVILPLVEQETPIPAVWAQARWNVRRNGFPSVFSHDGGIAYDHCGGPVVDRSGRVIGVNIARADAMQTFAIPSEVVRQVLAEMMGSSPK
jgi:serine protease Do